jgi:protein-S-isoprenylcysteine O-methyltransferase Ste14
MTFLPELESGWLNGWLLLFILYGVFGILLIIFPREVVSRLYERTGWTRQDYIRRIISLPVALATIGLFIFLPLRVGTAVFWIGLVIYAAGFAIFNMALINYRNTPLDQPVTRGLYRFSRNPQIVGLLVAFMGTAVSVGSWLLVILVALMSIGAHTRILAEERACLMQYGESYQAYMNMVPRYFGLPKQSPTAGLEK